MSATTSSIRPIDAEDREAVRQYFEVVGLEVQDALGIGEPGDLASGGSVRPVLPSVAEATQVAYPGFPSLSGIPGRTILVEGPTGIGKSTLAASLLSAFCGHRGWITTTRQALSFLHQSTVLNELRLSPTFPLFEVHLGSEPSTVAIEGYSTSLFTAGSIHPTRTPVGRAEIMRTIQGWLDQVRGARSRDFPTMVVIDDWGNLVNSLLDDPVGCATPPQVRSAVGQLLLSSLAEEGLHLVMLTEEGEEIHMGSTVETTVRLAMHEQDGRALRTLEVRSRRGGSLREPRMPFLVSQGRFRLPPPFPSDAIAWDYDPSASPYNPAGLWPGSSDLAKIFGRVAAGTLTLLELGKGVPLAGLSALTQGLALSAARAGGGAVVVPPPGSLGPLMERAVREGSRHPRIAQGMRFVGDDPNLQRSAADLGMLLPLAKGPDPAKPWPWHVIEEYLDALPSSSPKLILLSVEGARAITHRMESSVTGAVAPVLAAKALRQKGYTMVISERVENPVFSQHAMPQARQYRLFTQEGRVFIYGTCPRTPVWNLSARRYVPSFDHHLVVESAE